MAILEVECPECGEVLELTAEDRAELNVGDVIVCENCHTEMEVTVNEGQDFELEPLGFLMTCPNCGEEFDITEDMLDKDGTHVECPHCTASIPLEYDE